MRQARRFVAVTAVLGLVSLAATCNHGTPRHDTTVNLQVLVAAMHGLQDAEIALFNAGGSGITLDQHKALQGKLADAFQLADDAVTVVETWQPGEAIPAQLSGLIGSVRTLLHDGVLLIAPGLESKVLAVYDALTGILAAIGGV